MAYPTAAALKQAGNKIISIVEARNKDLVILEREMRAGRRLELGIRYYARIIYSEFIR